MKITDDPIVNLWNSLGEAWNHPTAEFGQHERCEAGAFTTTLLKTQEDLHNEIGLSDFDLITSMQTTSGSGVRENQMDIQRK